MAEARRRLIAGVRLTRKLAPWLASLALSLALTEAALRITGFASHQVLHASPPQAMFMGFDENLGWSFTPNASGVFSNGYFAGAFTIDAHGNRRNAPAGTYREGFRDILFIGDSTTASFEVDDAETVPALLERGLRDRGHDVNVVNLGVRGYSTGQSVRKAIGVAARFAPTDIVYLFVDNDIAGNNLIKRARKPLAKGVYIRRGGGGPFESLGYPVPRLPIAYGAVVMFDGACRPLVHEHSSLEAETVRAWRTALNRWLRNNVFVYGAIRFIVRSLTGKPDNYDHRGFGARPSTPTMWSCAAAANGTTISYTPTATAGRSGTGAAPISTRRSAFFSVTCEHEFRACGGSTWSSTPIPRRSNCFAAGNVRRIPRCSPCCAPRASSTATSTCRAGCCPRASTSTICAAWATPISARMGRPGSRPRSSTASPSSRPAGGRPQRIARAM